MDDNKNKKEKDDSSSPSALALYPYPPPYSALQFLGPPYHMYYHPTQYSNGIYQSYPPVQQHHHLPYASSVSMQPKPSPKGGRPLLAQTPPLMPHPPSYVPLYPHLTPQPGWNIVYPVGYKWAPSNETAKIQESPNKSSESCTPVMSDSQPKLIKVFEFLKESDLAADIQDADILIRGFLFEFDSSGDTGFLKSGSDFRVEIPKETMYYMGKKIDADKDFADAIALGSNIKALAKKVSQRKEDKGKIEEVDVIYRAIIAWFGEIPNIIDLKPVISQFKNTEEIHKESIMISQNRLVKGLENKNCVGKDVDKEDSESSTTFEVSHIHGYVWWANREQGIMRIYETKGWGPSFSGIIFKVDSLQFEDQKARCDKLLFLMAHLNKCYVYARRIVPKTLHGMLIKWEAISIDCGSVPQTLIRDVPHGESVASVGSLSNSQSPESFQDDEDSFNASKRPEIQNSLEDRRKYLGNSNCCDNYMENTSSRQNSKFTAVCEEAHKERNPQEEKRAKSNITEVGNGNDLYMIKDLIINDTSLNEEDLRDLFCNEYSGKHLTGRIIKLFPLKVGVGIALWKSMDFGNVYIIFRQNDMFVDLIPINKMMELPPSVYSRQCNLYVLPIKAQLLFGVKVQMVCNCGWLGTKPSCIPTPGEQLMAKIALNNLEPDTSCPNGDKSAQATCKSSSKEAPVPLSYTNVIQSFDGQKVDEEGFKNYLKNSPTFTDKVFSEDPSIIEEDKQKLDCYQTGEVVEIHCNMGKLMSKSGTHYFSREQCFLYGVSLHLVELWHVLVHGQKISFTLNQNSKGQFKVEKVVIGHKDFHPTTTNEVEKHIKEWCANNSVPDCAREILVHQVKKS